MLLAEGGSASRRNTSSSLARAAGLDACLMDKVQVERKALIYGGPHKRDFALARQYVFDECNEKCMTCVEQACEK